MKNKIFISIILFLFTGNLFSQYAVSISSPVNLRAEANTKAKISASLMENFIIADFISNTGYKQEIKIWNNNYNRDWSLLKLGSLQAYIYSLFVEKFDNLEDAEAFVKINKEYHKKLVGRYDFKASALATLKVKYDIDEDTSNHLYSDFMYDFTFGEAGRFKGSAAGFEGDHVTEEKIVGRYVVHNEGTIVFRGAISGIVSPEGYTWAEYYELAVGGKPTAKQLKAYKKSKKYKGFFKLSFPISEMNKLLIKFDDGN